MLSLLNNKIYIIILSMFVLGCNNTSPACEALDNQSVYTIPNGSYVGHNFRPTNFVGCNGDRTLGIIYHKDSGEILKRRHNYPCKLFTNNP